MSFSPSGDHSTQRGLTELVTSMRPLPSRLTTQMSKLPERLDAKARRSPSGDHDGV